MNTEMQPAQSAQQPVQLPSRMGQATAVEQSRAVAEVQAAIVVAQQCPRDLQYALREMEQSCQQKDLADRAFYRYNRGGQMVTGASVHLARELARCWGNVQYGVDEMRRDDDQGQSELKAWAWDVQTNTRSSQTFIVPHKRDKKGGPVKLVDLRDVYENNANNGARRLREAIFSVLPPWFTDKAKAICNDTVENGGGEPLAQRISKAIQAFDGLGVSQEQLEQKLERSSSKWTAHDMSQLEVIFGSLKRGETTREEEFPPKRVTSEELASKPQAGAPTNGQGAEASADGGQYELPADDPWAGQS